MRRLLSLKVTKEALLRMFADGLLVNFAVLASLTLRLYYGILFESEYIAVDHKQAFFAYMRAYEQTAVPLTLLCFMVFFVSGFYTRGRMYQGRYKALIVFQGVSSSYLIFAFASYFVGGGLEMPRAALILAWVLTSVLAIAARLWSMFWKSLASVERMQRNVLEDPPIRRVLVIGGAGYIGSALIPKLLAQGYHVRLLDLFLFGADPLEGVLDHPHLEAVEADFRQVDNVVKAMQDVDAVIHLGAIVGDPACALDEDMTMEINLMATRMIAEVAKGSGVSRMIFASTCSVYGASDQLLNERSSLKPVSLYARTKIASEKVLLKMADEHFSPTILRFGTIYGLSGRTRFDLVVNLLTAKAVVEKTITVTGGDQWRPFVHVDDAALAVNLSLRAPIRQVRNEVFNVGSNAQNYTIRQVGEAIRELVPGTLLIEGALDGDRRNYRVEFSKITGALGFKPKWSLAAGIRQVIESLAGGAVVDYKDPKYSNVKFLCEDTCHLGARGVEWAYNLIKEADEVKENEVVKVEVRK